MVEDFSTMIGISPLLTDDVVSEALSNWFKEPLTFNHWEYVGDTGKGDSYMSEVLRIKIYGKNLNNDLKHVQVISKRIPRSLARRLTYRCSDFFENEINFYTKVLPVILKFQAQKNIPDPFDKYAKMFLALRDGTNDVICLEDASIQNFQTAIRQEGIDLEHCKASFKALAQFHAISFAFKDQDPEKFDEIRKELSETYYHDRHSEWYKRFWKRLGDIAIDAVEKEYPNTIYVEKIKEFCVPERYQDMINAATNTLSTGVISHGDCWISNFLFKYENGKVVDAKMIDFQLARCATPVLDLTYMIYACTTQELRLKYYDELLVCYYEVLSSQIKAMGSDPEKIYSWELFKNEIKKYSYFGLAFSFEAMPFTVLPPEDAFDMKMEGDQKLDIDDVWPVKPFKTKEGRLREAHNLVHCVDNGYI